MVMAQLLTDPDINVNLCMARKNKKEGLYTQCPCPPKINDYCGRHGKQKTILRIDEPLPGKTTKTQKPVIQKNSTEVNPNPYTPDEFSGLTPNTINYRRLVATLRHHRINIKGNTEQLYKLCADFFENYYIDANLKSINAELITRLGGPGFTDRSICDNPSDFYDLTPLSKIPDIYFMSFYGENGRIYGCDFRSFHQLVESTKSSLHNLDMNIPGKYVGKILNPYTRDPIDQKYLDIYQEKKDILERNRLPTTFPTEEMDDDTVFKMKVLDTFQVMYSFGYTVDHEWFMSLNKNELFNLFNKIEDIWNYRLELTTQQKNNIVPNEFIFTTKDKNMASKYHAGSHDENYKKLRYLLHDLIRKMITRGKTKADCINGTIYVLGGLVQVSTSAAQALPEIVFAAGIEE